MISTGSSLQKYYYGRTAGMKSYTPLEGPKRSVAADRVKSAAAATSQIRRGSKAAVTSSKLTSPVAAKAWTVDSIYHSSSAALGAGAAGPRIDSSVRAQGKQMPPNATGDLVVTSARIVSIQHEIEYIAGSLWLHCPHEGVHSNSRCGHRCLAPSRCLVLSACLWCISDLLSLHVVSVGQLSRTQHKETNTGQNCP